MPYNPLAAPFPRSDFLQCELLIPYNRAHALLRSTPLATMILVSMRKCILRSRAL